MYLSRIKDLREDNNFFQKDLANLLCITQRNYSYIETGKTECPIDILIKLSYIYNTSTDYILGITNLKRPYSRINQN